MDVAVILPHESIDTEALEAVLRSLSSYTIDPDLVSSDGRSLQAQGGHELVADGRLATIEPQAYDCYVVVGCAGTQHSFDDAETESFLADVTAADIPLLAVCDAVGMLAETGLLEDCAVAACQTDMLRVAEQVDRVVDEPYARCGSIFTVCAEDDVPEAVAALLDAAEG